MLTSIKKLSAIGIIKGYSSTLYHFNLLNFASQLKKKFKFFNFLKRKTIFERIIDKEIPSKILFEDKHCCAINDINPQAPCHILLFPKNKEGLPGIAEADQQKQDLLGHLLITAAKLAKQFDLINGYRIIINQGEDGGQTIPHLHLHILGGQKLGITGFN